MAQAVSTALTASGLGARPDLDRHRRPRAAMLAVAVTLVGAVATLYLILTLPLAVDEQANSRTAAALFVVGMSGLTLAGGVLARQQPHATMAWLLLLTGLAGVLSRGSVGLALALNDGRMPETGLSGWVASWAWVPAQVLGMLLLLRFPTGRLPTRRWRAVEWVLLLWAALATAGTVLNFWILPVRDFLDVLFVVLFGLVLAVVAAPVTRWRSASDDERRQLAWVAGAAVLIAVAGPVAVTFEAGALLEGLAYLVLPGAIAVAVLRHRLWDVDVRRRLDRLRLVREEERLRLRRELHDSLGPLLGTISMRSEAARNLVAAGAEPARVDTLLASIGADTEGALLEVRRLIDELGPSALDDQDLAGALREHLSSYVDGPRLTLDVPEPLSPLEPQVENAAYQIAREAIRNAVRHSGARQCRTTLRRHGDELVVSVEDDGRGLAGQPAGVGRQGMERRATAVGGTLTVTEAPGGGVRVAALLPGVSS